MIANLDLIVTHNVLQSHEQFPEEALNVGCYKQGHASQKNVLNDECYSLGSLSTLAGSRITWTHAQDAVDERNNKFRRLIDHLCAVFWVDDVFSRHAQFEDKGECNNAADVEVQDTEQGPPMEHFPLPT